MERYIVEARLPDETEYTYRFHSDTDDLEAARRMKQKDQQECPDWEWRIYDRHMNKAVT